MRTVGVWKRQAARRESVEEREGFQGEALKVKA